VPVLDRYKDRGIIFMMGKVESGTISKGQQVTLVPQRKRLEIVCIEIESGEVLRARPGENVNIGLSGIGLSEIQAGFVLCDVDQPIPCVTSFEAQLAIIDLLPHKSIFTAGYSAMMHIHTASVDITVTDLLTVIDKKTRQPSKRKPTFVTKGDITTVRMLAESAVCLETFAVLQQLGRFTLRDGGKTIAIGKIIALQ